MVMSVNLVCSVIRFVPFVWFIWFVSFIEVLGFVEFTQFLEFFDNFFVLSLQGIRATACSDGAPLQQISLMDSGVLYKLRKFPNQIS